MRNVAASITVFLMCFLNFISSSEVFASLMLMKMMILSVLLKRFRSMMEPPIPERKNEILNLQMTMITSSLTFKLISAIRLSFMNVITCRGDLISTTQVTQNYIGCIIVED